MNSRVMGRVTAEPTTDEDCIPVQAVVLLSAEDMARIGSSLVRLENHINRSGLFDTVTADMHGRGWKYSARPKSFALDRAAPVTSSVGNNKQMGITVTCCGRLIVDAKPSAVTAGLSFDDVRRDRVIDEAFLKEHFDPDSISIDSVLVDHELKQLRQRMG